MIVEKKNSSRSVKSVSHTKGVLSPRRCKTVGFRHTGSVLKKDDNFRKWIGCTNLKLRNSGSAIRKEKQSDLIRDCVVKLKRLSQEDLIKVLPRKKAHQRPETQSETDICDRHETGKYYFLKSSVKCGMRKEIQKRVEFKENGIFEEQHFANTWGNVKLDSWGNVRSLREGCGDLFEPEEDWLGWWVHIDSFHNLPNAQLYSISDGVKESRTLVWNNAIKPTVDKGVEAPAQSDNECDKKHCNWDGCTGFCYDVSDDEGAEFTGW